jgi:hypothetical protein
MKNDRDDELSMIGAIKEVLEFFEDPCNSDLVTDLHSNKTIIDLVEGPTRGKKQRATDELLVLAILAELVTSLLHLLFAFFRRIRNVSQLAGSPKHESGANRHVDLPHLARLFLSFIADEKDQETITGDLTEEYFAAIDTAGLRRAKMWLYGQALQSALPLLTKTIRNDVFEPISSWLQVNFSVVKSETPRDRSDEAPTTPDIGDKD